MALEDIVAIITHAQQLTNQFPQPQSSKFKQTFQHQRKMVIRCIRDTNSLNTQDDGSILSCLDHI